jgi:RNA-directed DNA polymerase
MSRLSALKSAKTRDELAALLQTSAQGLNAILYSRPIATRYTTFEIPKKHGGTRTIKAPDEKLKLLQQKLSSLLQDCLDEMEANRNRKKQVAHGFKRKCSILTNAKRHRNRRWVFNLDLKDFFPSMHFGRVRGLFLKDKNFLLENEVATVLAQIACDGSALPQGSPCSPVISNLVARILDMHLVRLASKNGCIYTRYADDLTFSTNQKEFPREIAYQIDTDTSTWVPGNKLLEVIHHSDFEINEKKTRMQFRDSRQDVTGLIVNKKVNVPCEYRHTVRAMVHRLFRTGAFQIVAYVTNNDTAQLALRDGKLAELHGRLGFIDGIDLHNQALAKENVELSQFTTKESIYKQFLIYRDFYATEKPVILCEGKTDNTYLKHAIRNLAAEFPELAEIDASGKVTLKIRIYKYTKTSTGRILGLKDGGSSQLARFISSYRKNTDKFGAPGLQNPVIILFDNDSGAKAIRSSAKEARLSGKAVDPKDQFTHIVKNLYLVPTPLLPGKEETKIEDFFDDDIKKTVIAGKTLSTDNTFDKTVFYGKSDFAEQVIAPHAKTINFKNFAPLMTSISMVIKEHAKITDLSTVATG